MMKFSNLKKHIAWLLPVFIMMAFTSCKKNQSLPNPNNQEILTKKIQEIIPQNYLDTLKKYGLEIYGEPNAPTVAGTYAIKQHVLQKSNIKTDVAGYRFTDAKISLSAQSTTDFSIKFTGENFLENRDTSIATAISGSGNNFTIYGKVKSVSGSNSAVFAIVISGSKEGDNLKNIKTGIINVDNSKGGAVFIKEGEARVAYDSDLISEKVAPTVAVKAVISGTGSVKALGAKIKN